MTHHETHESKQDENRRHADPKPADAQSAPAPERPETVQEAEGQAVRQQDDPAQAEGGRDEAER